MLKVVKTVLRKCSKSVTHLCMARTHFSRARTHFFMARRHFCMQKVLQKCSKSALKALKRTVNVKNALKKLPKKLDVRFKNLSKALQKLVGEAPKAPEAVWR